MKPLTKAVTVFAFAGAATAFVPSGTSTLRGDIDIVSYGVATLAADDGAPISAVHVRETFTNRSDASPWVVDFSEARLWLGGATFPEHPMFVNSDTLTLPLLIIGRGQHRVADLYFPIDEKRPDDDALASFTVTYRLRVGEHRYEHTLMLGHSNHWPTREERGPEPGWGSHWWSDPTYPWSQYWHRPGRVVPRPPKHIDILHVPRAYYDEVPTVAEQWPRTDECNEW